MSILLIFFYRLHLCGWGFLMHLPVGSPASVDCFSMGLNGVSVRVPLPAGATLIRQRAMTYGVYGLRIRPGQTCDHLITKPAQILPKNLVNIHLHFQHQILQNRCI